MTPCSYVAQTTLFDQIPQLAKDFTVPDYTSLIPSQICDGDDSEQTDEAVKINAWFGPAGTVSPTHHDPYHNLFCQAVGAKCVLRFYLDLRPSRLTSLFFSVCRRPALRLLFAGGDVSVF
jgi:hypothetical protein